MADLWIEVLNWDKFQHYKDRDPPWIKNYLDLLHREEYLALTDVQRTLLHGLWLLYAASNKRLRWDIASINAALRLRARKGSLEALADGGFIRRTALAPGTEIEVRWTRDSTEMDQR